MKAGDKVVCIDAEGWLLPDPGFDHLAPKRGVVYTVRQYTREFGVACLSLMEGQENHFYRAFRFRPVAPAELAVATEEARK